jgi:CRISPR/Cas system-associated endonuclease Cas3-HD
LCFLENGSVPEGPEVKTSSKWNKRDSKWDKQVAREDGKPQGLFEHVSGVVEGTRKRLISGGAEGSYRKALLEVARSLEPRMDPERLADTIAQIAILGAAFHDLGKAGSEWQEKAREVDPHAQEGLIGRTRNTQARVKFPPHTPPGFSATLKACELLLGKLDPAAEHLVRVIALAAARHHSSLTNPAAVEYTFEPDQRTTDFVRSILRTIDAPTMLIDRAEEIVQAAVEKPSKDMIPLALPNDDLFPIYALVGRAILMADREDAAEKELEQWQMP